jgi:hypothetical protein
MTLSPHIVNGHVAYRSLKVTPATRAMFIEACSGSRRIWIDGRTVPCLSAGPIDSGDTVQVEVRDDGKPSPAGYYHLVSTKPVSSAVLRELTAQERSAVLSAAAAPAGRPALLRGAKATSGQNGQAIVFVPHDKDRDGHRPTDVFSVTHGGTAAHIGRLPDWPDKVMKIDGAPQAIVNLGGEATVVRMYSLRPRVEAQMFVSES